MQIIIRIGRIICTDIAAEDIYKVLSSPEHSGKLLSRINSLSAKEKLGITVSSFSLSEDLTAALEVARIDYPTVVKKFLPAVKKSLLNAEGVPSLFRPIIRKASAEQICAFLDRLPSDKDTVLATLINRNRQQLITKIQDMAQENGIRLTVVSLEAHA